MKNLILLFSVVFFSVVQKIIAQPVITFLPVVTSGLSSPVDVVAANDGTNRIFIVERGGTIKVYDDTYALLNNNFLTINADITVGGEQGLLSLAFHPDFENNRYFFVYYTNGSAGVNIDRFQTLVGNPNQADIATRTNIMSIAKPIPFTNHNGGKLNFGADGNLYFGLGDSGSSGDPANLSQSGNSLWGKMIRINVDNFTTPPYYTIPPDNPYIADPTILDELFSFGLRNPWRWSFDRLTGNAWIADVGQGAREEVNQLTQAQSNGANYGWRCYEGTLAYNTTGCLPQASYVQPVYDYPHNNITGGFSITGGYVYRGSIYPAMAGYYICADFVSANGFIINTSTLSATLQPGFPTTIAGFGEKENGELLAVSLSGVLLSVRTSTIVPLQLVQWRGIAADGHHNLYWQNANEDGIKKYEIEFSEDGFRFTKLSETIAKNEANAAYTYKHNTQQNKLFYRLKIIKVDGSFEYAKIIVLENNNDTNSPKISYYNNKTIVIQNTTSNTVQFQLFNATGQFLKSMFINTQNKFIDLQQYPAGLYVGIITINGKVFKEKIVLH
jgi:glucose/arabinose dehydrogenase